MDKFALIGLGYISERHIEAMEYLGYKLELALDPKKTSINFKNKQIHVQHKEDEFYKKLSSSDVGWVSICSPTFCHYRQILKCLSLGCNVIVEKPICLTLKELEIIRQKEILTNKRVFTMFQLRYHSLTSRFQDIHHENDVSIFYRGNRNLDYFRSWKGNIDQSGGIVAAVGIHYFDLLTNYFGEFTGLINVEHNSISKSKGLLQLSKAMIHWDFEFIQKDDHEVKTQRNFVVNGVNLDFSEYTQNLHTKAYEAIKTGKGVSIEETKKSLKIIEAIAKYS